MIEVDVKGKSNVKMKNYIRTISSLSFDSTSTNLIILKVMDHVSLPVLGVVTYLEFGDYGCASYERHMKYNVIRPAHEELC